jgi:hypothetical protein
MSADTAYRDKNSRLQHRHILWIISRAEEETHHSHSILAEMLLGLKNYSLYFRKVNWYI